jgi:hypothetical protein
LSKKQHLTGLSCEADARDGCGIRQTGANTIMQTETARGHWHAMKSLVRFAAAWAAFACVALLVTPATASGILYTVDFHSGLHNGQDGFITGTITTDGTIGALQPGSILGFDLTSIICGGFCGSPVEEIGVSGSWTPSSFSATSTDLFFDFGPQYTASLFLGPFAYFPGCPQPGQCGTFSLRGPQFFITNEIQHIASEGVTVPIPAPIVGAGLPGLILASGGLLGWWRRRQKPVRGRIANAKSIGWAIYAAGFAIWLFWLPERRPRPSI